MKQWFTLFHDIPESNEGPSSMDDYYLQRESKEWEGCINVTDYVQERDVILLCVSSSAVVSEVTLISLSTVVLNSRDRPENTWLPKGMHLDTQ